MKPKETYADTVRRLVNEDAAQASAAVVLGAEGTSPQQVLKYRQLAAQTGAPMGAVKADPEGARRAVERKQLEDLRASSPSLARWLTDDGDRYALARDDIGNLSKLGLAIERTYKATRDYGLESGMHTFRNHVFDWRNIGRAAPGGQNGIRASREAHYLEELAGAFSSNLKRAEAKYATATRALLPESLPESIRGSDFQHAVQLASIEREAQQREVTQSRATEQAFKELEAASKGGLLDALQAWATNPRAVGITIAQSLGLGADGLAMTAATAGSSRLVTAVTAGATSGQTEYASTLFEVMKESGVDLADPHALRRAMQNPELMEKAKTKAAQRGLVVGAFDFLTAGLAGHFLKNARANLGSISGAVAAEAGLQVAGGSAGELTAQLVTGDKVNWVEVVGEGFAEIGMGAGEVHANYQTAKAHGELRTQRETLQTMLESDAGARQLGDIMEAAQASQLAQQSPEAFAELLSSTTSPDANVYLDVAVARTLFQSERIGADAFIDELVGEQGAAFEAAATGGDLVIPLADFVAKLAHRPDAAEIARHARLDASHVSRAELESESFMDEQLAKWFGDTNEAAARAQPVESEAGRERVKQDVLGMLMATGRYKGADAEANAEALSLMVGRLADMAGVDPWEHYARYRLRINNQGGQQVAGQKPNTIDPVSDGLLLDALNGVMPSESEAFGPGLARWLVSAGGIQDYSGELAAMDARLVMPGLVNKRGMTLDRALEAATEAGYFTDREEAETGVKSLTVTDFVDALREDLNGNGVYSPSHHDPAKVKRREEIQNILRALDEHEVLREKSPSELAAMNRQDIWDMLFPEDVLEQTAYHGTPHRGIENTGFQLNKIGTGEGAQAYGWGIYFAGQRAVAEHYRKGLSYREQVRQFMRELPEDADIEEVMEALERGDLPQATADVVRALANEDWLGFDYPAQAITAAFKELDNFDPSPELREAIRRYSGQLYQVDIPEDSGLLDWDAPLSKQPEKVKTLLRPLLARFFGDGNEGYVLNDGEGAPQSGKELYMELGGFGPQAQRASELLSEHGIPGLRYLDGDSRAAGEGSHNYVIWDEALLTPEAAKIEALYQSPAESGASSLEAEIAAERTATERAHGGRAAYDKAKAEGRTKLTYHQWIEVRTPRFKQWFGNWEAVQHREFLDGEPVKVLSGSEFAPDGVPLTEKVPKWYAEQGVSTVDVAGIGEVALDAVAVKRSLGHGIGRDKATAFAAVPDVLRNGRIIHSEVMRGSIDGMVYHVAAPIEIAGKAFVMDVLVKSDANASRMYVHEVALKEMLQQSDFKVGAVAAKAGKRADADDAGAIRSVLQGIYAVNPAEVSKVIDPETGEPLVVYHGTNSDSFSVFERNNLGDETYTNANKTSAAMTAGLGHWFNTENLSETTSVYSRAESVFLNIREPKEFSYLDNLMYEMEGFIPENEDGELMSDVSDFDDTQGITDAAKAALDAMLDDGFDGIVIESDTEFGGTSYVAFNSNQIKSATANNGNYSADADSILAQQKGDKPRGQIRFLPERTFSIDLFEGADGSTFMHEAAHFVLEQMQDLAEKSEAVKAELDRVRAWLGNDGGKFTTDEHERFARGFELYLREGKAPVPGLRGLFERMKNWLMQAYKHALELNVTLNDDIRGVFDRLLASEAEIEAAKRKQGDNPLALSKEARGLLKAGQYEKYVEAREAALAEAREALLAKLNAAERRKHEQWWKKELKALVAQKLAEIDASPVGRAQQRMRADKSLRLDKAALVARYGKAWTQDSLRALGVYTVKGGLNPETAAMLFGFDSGDALVKTLADLPDMRARAKDWALSEMYARHGDPMTDGSLPEAAMEAIHGNKRLQLLEKELGLLSELAGQPFPPLAVVREYARRKVAGMPVRKLKPNTHLTAARRAALKMARFAAEGKFAEALQAKRQEAISIMLYREALAGQKSAKSVVNYLKRFTVKKRRAALGKAGHDYLEQVDGLLAAIDLRAVSEKSAQRRKTLAEWVEQQRAAGQAVDVSEKLLNAAFRKPYQDMTLDELTEVRDTVKQIAHLADLKGKLRLGAELRDAAEVDAAMADSVLSGHSVADMSPGVRDNRSKLKDVLGQYRANLASASDIARELDGYQNLGAVWRNTVGVIREAVQERLKPALEKAQQNLAELLQAHYDTKALRGMKTRIKVPGVRGVWSKESLLMLAMNRGNKENWAAILGQRRRGVTAVEADVLLQQLDANDWAFVQSVWDMLDSYWPQIAESQRRRKGLVPKRVEADAFAIVTKDGKQVQLRGGYFPLKFEYDSADGKRDEMGEVWDALRAGRFASASTRDNHTKERVGSGGRTVRLDFGVIHSHLLDVNRDLHLGDEVNYVHSVLNGKAFKQAVSDTGNAELLKGLDVWLRDVAIGEMALRQYSESWARAFRTNFTAAVLTWKPTTALIQITGVTQSAAVLGSDYVLHGLKSFLSQPGAMLEYAASHSPFMAARAKKHVEAVEQVRNAFDGRFKVLRNAMIRNGYRMIAWVQQLVDTVTWLAAEKKGMALFGGDVARARQYADDIVARAQGSGEWMDKNALQRGSFGDRVRQTEWIAATTALQSYLMAKASIAYEKADQLVRDVDGFNAKSLAAAMQYSMDMLLLFAVEGIVMAALMGKLPSDEDDDDGLLDDWAKFVFSDAGGQLLGGIPGLGSLVRAAKGFDSQGVVASMWESAADTGKQIGQGEADKALAKSVVKMAGFWTGIPSSQINKTIDAIAAEADGKDVSPFDYIRGVPKEKDRTVTDYLDGEEK